MEILAAVSGVSKQRYARPIAEVYIPERITGMFRIELN